MGTTQQAGLAFSWVSPLQHTTEKSSLLCDSCFFCPQLCLQQQGPSRAQCLAGAELAVSRFTPCTELALNIKMAALSVDSGNGARAVVWILNRLFFATLLYSCYYIVC